MILLLGGASAVREALPLVVRFAGGASIGVSSRTSASSLIFEVFVLVGFAVVGLAFVVLSSSSVVFAAARALVTRLGGDIGADLVGIVKEGAIGQSWSCCSWKFRVTIIPERVIGGFSIHYFGIWIPRIMLKG